MKSLPPAGSGRRERVLAAGKTVVLSKPSKTVAQILDIANFSKLFTIL